MRHVCLHGLQRCVSGGGGGAGGTMGGLGGGVQTLKVTKTAGSSFLAHCRNRCNGSDGRDLVAGGKGRWIVYSVQSIIKLGLMPAES